MNYEIKNGIVIDERGNRAEVSYFGSEELAIDALKSLVNCHNCINCHNCYNCHYCYNCTDCNDCTFCTDCTDCYDCHDCNHCKKMFGRRRQFNTTIEFSIPKIDNIHQKVYQAATQTDYSLNMEAWHTCETTHCRAGWVVHLAGEAGYELEKRTFTPFAAMLIYKENSNIAVSYDKFYGSEPNALADMKRCAEEEVKCMMK